MDSEKPFWLLGNRSYVGSGKSRKICVTCTCERSTDVWAWKRAKRSRKGLIATESLNCLPRGAGLRPWRGGEGHQDQRASLWTIWQWYWLQSPKPDSNDPRTGKRHGKWAQHEDGETAFKGTVVTDHCYSGEAVELTRVCYSKPRWAIPGCREHTGGSCWHMELPALPAHVSWCDLGQLGQLLWASFSSPIKLGVRMADFKNPCWWNIVQFNNDVWELSKGSHYT